MSNDGALPEHPLSRFERNAILDICNRIPGWSGERHYLFFKEVLGAYPQIERILWLGVYHGRDIAFLLDILRRHHPGRMVEIVGVDRFSADPCADWPAEKSGMTWGEAFGCPPPDYAAAVNNTESRMVSIVKQCDESFLLDLFGTDMRFDWAYLDTDHTEKTVARQIRQVAKICRGDAIISGDDYRNAGTWGVPKAVSGAFTGHEVFADWLWHSRHSLLKP